MGLKLLIAKGLKKILNPPALRNCKIDSTARVCSKSELNGVRIGKYSYIGNDCFMVNVGIGAFCSIADRVCIGGASHPIERVLHRYFRAKEKKLYKLSDRIGCMSPANVAYVLEHNPEIPPERVEVCPNCIEVIDKSVDGETRRQIRGKYGIPLNKKVFVYGGNLGKPQGIPFLVECLEKCKDIEGAFFLVVGNGTEYGKLETYANSSSQKNFKLMSRLPKEDYDTLVGACDVGLIFLDHRFTIPNFPSRLLSYMQAGLPVLACTDPNTDIGKVITEGGFGWWCESDSINDFSKTVFSALNSLNEKGDAYMQEKEIAYLFSHYSVEDGYKKIMNSRNWR